MFSADKIWLNKVSQKSVVIYSVVCLGVCVWNFLQWNTTEDILRSVSIEVNGVQCCMIIHILQNIFSSVLKKKEIKVWHDMSKW